MIDQGGVLLRASAAGETVRAMVAVTTGVVEEARQRHGTFPTATAALGRALTAGLLLGSTMKDEERLSIEGRRVRVAGPCRGPAPAIIQW